MEAGTYQLSGNKFFVGNEVYHLGERCSKTRHTKWDIQRANG